MDAPTDEIICQRLADFECVASRTGALTTNITINTHTYRLHRHQYNNQHSQMICCCRSLLLLIVFFAAPTFCQLENAVISAFSSALPAGRDFLASAVVNNKYFFVAGGADVSELWFDDDDMVCGHCVFNFACFGTRARCCVGVWRATLLCGLGWKFVEPTPRTALDTITHRAVHNVK